METSCLPCIDAVGTSYFIQDYGEASPAADRRATVIALTDATQVTINSTLVTAQAAGDSHSFTPVPIGTTQAVTIQTSAPAYVYQSHGAPSSCELGMAIVPPASVITSTTTVPTYRVGVNLPGSGYAFTLALRPPTRQLTATSGAATTTG